MKSRLTLYAAAMLLAFLPTAQADTPDQIEAACTASAFELDCACVADTYDAASAGLGETEAGLLGSYLVAAIGQTPAEDPSGASPVQLMAISERLTPVMSVSEDCRASVEVADDTISTEAETVSSACSASDYHVDCACVSELYTAQAPGVSDTGRTLLRDIIAETIDVSETDWSEPAPELMINYSDQIDAVARAPEVCAVTPEAGARAAAQAVDYSDWSEEDREGASERQAVEIECQSFGNSPAYCACHVEVAEGYRGDAEMRFKTEASGGSNSAPDNVFEKAAYACQGF